MDLHIVTQRVHVGIHQIIAQYFMAHKITLLL